MNANDIPVLHSMELLAILCDVLVKGAVLLFAASLITMAMRKASAAARHLVWVIALCGVLVLPLFSAVMPSLRLRILPTVATVASTSASTSHLHILPARKSSVRLSAVVTAGPLADHVVMPRPRLALGASVRSHANAATGTHNGILAAAPPACASSMTTAIAQWIANRWPLLLLAIWIAGVVLIGLVGLMGYARLAWRLARARTISTGPIALLAAQICRELQVARPVPIAIDESLLIPLAHGIFRPRVLLPAAAESWPSDKLRSVLLHELAHVARWDCASLFFGQIACTLHWPDPLVWVSWRRLRSECERACDDAVLRCSTAPADYAENLLAIARDLHSAALPVPATLAMARPSELKGRIVAILDERRNRRPIPVGWMVGMLLAGTLIVASFAALHLQAKPPVPNAQPGDTQTATAPLAQQKTMTLTVIDKQTGKPLAGAVVKVWNRPALHTAFNGTVEVPVPNSFPKTALSLSVKSPFYVPMELTWNSQNTWPGRIPSRYTLKMWRGKTISGRVDDDAGNPIPGAHVQVWWDLKPQASPAVDRIDAYPVWAVTDAQGFWHCAGVPVGHLKAVSLGVWDYNYVWDLSSQAGAFSGWMPLRKFTDFHKLLDGRAVYILQRGIIVHGTVRGPDGKPVPGAKVVLGNDRIATNVPPPLVADKHGRFAFAVKPGQWVFVTATAKGYGPILKKFIAGKKPSALSINLTPPYLLTGLVVGPSGRPIAGAWVFTDRWRGCRTLVHTMRTDDEGRFIWNGAPAGRIFVNAQSSGYAYTNDVAIRAGGKNRIELRYQVTVHGTVVDARTGEPIHKFQVIGGAASAPASPGTAPGIFWNTRFPREVVDDGHFTYRPWGQWPMYAIRIEAEGYSPADSKLFTNAVRNVYLRFKLMPAKNIAATILNPDGTPAAGAKALLVPAGQGATIGFQPFAMSQGNISSVADHRGLLSFAPQAGDFKIAVYDHDGYAVVTRDNFAKSKFVRLLPWGEIHDRLLFGTKPAPGQTVEINSPAGYSELAFSGIQWSRLEKTNSKGGFICNQLPVGKVSVRLIIWRPGSGTTAFIHGGGLNRTATVQAGKIAEVTLGGRGRCVEGRVIIPPTLTHRGHWHFGLAIAATKGPALPMPENIRHGTNASQNKWAQAFFATAAGRKWSANDERWAKTNSKVYCFIIKPYGHFLIPDVVPGTYRMRIAVLNGRKPVPMMAYIHVPALATAKATFTVPPIPGGVTDVPLKIPPLKLVPVKTANPADPPAPAPAAKAPPAVKTVPAMAQIVAPSAAQTPKTMTLTVIDKQTGKPLAGVRVIAIASMSVTARIVTDSDGRASLTLPKQSSSGFEIIVQAPRYVREHLYWGPEPEQGSSRVQPVPVSYTLALPRGTQISGRVVDDEGTPVAGAHVMLWLKAKSETPHERPGVLIKVRTENNGSWHYDGVPANGVASIGMGVWDRKYIGSDSYIPLKTLHNLTRLRDGTAVFILHRGITVHGVVRGPNNKPVAGAKVALGSDINGDNTPQAITTDAMGRFAFVAKRGSAVIATATAPNYGPALTQATVKRRGTTLILKLTAPHLLAGKVVNTAGQPLAHAIVIVDTWHGYRTLQHLMRTDSRGRFDWAQAPAGKILVDVQCVGFAYTQLVPVRAETTNVITIRHTVTVHGTVVNAKTGKPIRKFTIIRGGNEIGEVASAGKQPAIYWDRMYPETIAGNGSFAYTLPNQRAAYAIRIEASGYLPADSRLFPNNKRNIFLAFKLTPAPEITAKVLNPDGSVAVGAKAILIPAGHNATIYLTGFDETQSATTARIGADGQMNLVPQKGNYQIVIYDGSGSAVLSRSQMPKSGIIHLAKWGHIQGLLLFGTKPGADKKILAYRSIPMVPNHQTYHFTGASWWVTTRTDSAGRFRIPRFPAGKASVQMRISGPLVGSSGALVCPVTVLPGKTANVTLGGVGQTVEGRIIIPRSVAAIRDWYFEMGDADTRRPSWPMPFNIKHGTNAQRSHWFSKFFATAAGKAFLNHYQLWMRTKFHDYNFVIGADNTFTIRDVVPGIYNVTAVAVNPAVKVPQRFGYSYGTIGTVHATFTVPPIPGGVTDVPLIIPPLKLVPMKTAKD